MVGIGGHPLMAFGLPPQAAGQQADEKASSCSPRKQDAMQAGDNGDQGEGETAHVAASAPFKRDSRKDQSAADLTEVRTTSLFQNVGAYGRQAGPGSHPASRT